MATKKPQKPERGALSRKIKVLMAATGLTYEGCRQLLKRQGRPRNPITAAAWDKAMRSVA